VVARTVLITGCSSGFGLETSLSLAERGWQVHASMRDTGKAAALEERAGRAGVGSRLNVIQLDVTDLSSIDRAVKEVLDTTGGTLDALVANAGIGSGGAFEDLPDAEIRRVFDTNFHGVLNVTRAVLPAMRAQRSGRIVAVTSDNAFYGAPGVSAYAASKFAVEGWAESIAYELDAFGIQVICVEPGAYRTPIWDSTPRYIPPDSAYRPLAERIERFVDTKLVPGARDPREVGEAIAKALEARRPRFRVAVGPDAKAMAAAHGIVPHRPLAAALRRYIGLHDLRTR
jgi:NAD(P)-dependent dehydrogenase (short-subunit alcohol dehydrogenase family)